MKLFFGLMAILVLSSAGSAANALESVTPAVLGFTCDFEVRSCVSQKLEALVCDEEKVLFHDTGDVLCRPGITYTDFSLVDFQLNKKLRFIGHCGKSALDQGSAVITVAIQERVSSQIGKTLGSASVDAGSKQLVTQTSLYVDPKSVRGDRVVFNVVCKKKETE